MNAVNLADKLSQFAEHWQPRTVGGFNGHDIMVVKVKGEFVWQMALDFAFSINGDPRRRCMVVLRRRRDGTA
jgi:hypothetical protein